MIELDTILGKDLNDHAHPGAVISGGAGGNSDTSDAADVDATRQDALALANHQYQIETADHLHTQVQNDADAQCVLDQKTALYDGDFGRHDADNQLDQQIDDAGYEYTFVTTSANNYVSALSTWNDATQPWHKYQYDLAIAEQ